MAIADFTFNMRLGKKDLIKDVENIIKAYQTFLKALKKKT